MTELQFYKVNPTANMTILVETPLPRARYAAVSEALMAYEHVYAEQVGFIEQPACPHARVRLHMMGGEFCGNASMSLAAVLAYKDGISALTEIPLEVSGTDALIRVKLHPEQDGYRCRVNMPLPEYVGAMDFPYDGKIISLPFVRFSGIAFAIAQNALDAENCIKAWHSVAGGEAFGILLWDANTQYMRPLVRVAATDSAVWEHGCGSGTSAMGAWLSANANQPIQADIHQPGGTIRVYADSHNNMLDIEGYTALVCRGTAYIRNAILK